VIASPCLDGRDRYERAMEGWIDNTHEDAFTHAVRLADETVTVELRAVCTPSPGYEVRAAQATVRTGAGVETPVPGVAALAGARMVAGFSRRLQEVAGDGPGASAIVDAGIEVARLARQVAKLPAEALRGLVPGDARRCWELDTTGWVDLPDSCFTYSAAGRALFATRAVSTPMAPELYRPAAGATKVFRRAKRARLVRTGGRLDLFHSMHDNVHGFDVHYQVDLARGVIVAADCITARLPYVGICDEPQARIRSLVGERLDAGFRKRIQTAIGGASGCAQLYDLTADLLKLLTLD
jgi:hypothetical protein